MFTRVIFRSSILCLGLGLVSCNLTASISPSPSLTPSAALTATLTPTAIIPPTPSSMPRPPIRRVVILSLDGLGSQGLLQSRIPRISELINGGASTFAARTILPSGTLPAHASMVSGRCVNKHGIVWNDLVPSAEPLQGDTVFSVAKQAGLRTVMVVGKEKLVTLARPGTVDTFQYVNGSDEQIVQAAIRESQPDFGVLFVHLILPDFFGHRDGWMSAPYLAGVGRDDTAVGTLLDGLRSLRLMDGTLVILNADHGGHGTTHGTNDKADMTIPWVVFGPGVLVGSTISVPVSIMDTAATAVWGLGLPLPADWDGRPVVEAFGLTAEQALVPAASDSHCGIY